MTWSVTATSWCHTLVLMCWRLVCTSRVSLTTETSTAVQLLQVYKNGTCVGSRGEGAVKWYEQEYKHSFIKNSHWHSQHVHEEDSRLIAGKWPVRSALLLQTFVLMMSRKFSCSTMRRSRRLSLIIGGAALVALVVYVCVTNSGSKEYVWP